MNDIEDVDDAQEDELDLNSRIMQAYGSLPGGVQRIIIAVLVIFLLVAMMFLRDMINKNKSRHEEEGSG